MTFQLSTTSAVLHTLLARTLLHHGTCAYLAASQFLGSMLVGY